MEKHIIAAGGVGDRETGVRRMVYGFDGRNTGLYDSVASIGSSGSAHCSACSRRVDSRTIAKYRETVWGGGVGDGREIWQTRYLIVWVDGRKSFVGPGSERPGGALKIV